MSEKEKIMRAKYQRRRKGWITFQTIVIVLVTLVLAFGGYLYYGLNKATFVPYTQKGNVIYKAYLADNAFYEQEYLNGSHAYVASLVEKMTADFEYDLKIDADDVKFKYSYKIDAQVEVRDTETQMAIFNPVFELIPAKTMTGSGSTVSVKDAVELDYNKYNKLAKDFIASYSLDDTQSLLIVRMYVDVLGESQEFAADNKDSYTVELFVPLNKKTVTPYVVTPVSEQEQKVLTVNNNDTIVLKYIVLGVFALDLILVLILALYTRLTRDKHIDYSRKVKRILSSYTSYIQRVNNPVVLSDYQVLNVDTFGEMLEIRDTLQMPILMFENNDRTCTQFFIVNDRILYLFKINVEDDFEDYDYWDDDLETTEEETVKF